MFNMMDMFNGSFNGNQANMDSGYSGDGNSNNQYFNNGNYMANDVNSGNNSSSNNILNNFMNSNQRDLYNEYLRQLDSLDLNFNSDIITTTNKSETYFILPLHIFICK